MTRYTHYEPEWANPQTIDYIPLLNWKVFFGHFNFVTLVVSPSYVIIVHYIA